MEKKYGSGKRHRKAFIKALTWRVLSTITSFILVLIVFGNLQAAGSYAALEAVIKFGLYYFHELGWQGKLKDETETNTPY